MKKRREKKTWLIDIRKYDRIFFFKCHQHRNYQTNGDIFHFFRIDLY